MLRNWPIRSKLVVILIVPLAALAVLSAIQVRGNVDNVRAADRIEALADFSIKASDLVHHLQLERYASNAFAGSRFSIAPLGQVVTQSRGPVDEALGVYRAGEQALPDSARSELSATLAAISEHLNRLPDHRKQFDARQMQAAENVAFYDAAVKDLLMLNARVASGSTDARLVNGATTLAGISQAKEQASQQRGAVAQMLFRQTTEPQTIWALEATAGAEDAWIEQFRTTATQGQQELFDSTVGRSYGNVDQVRERIIGALSGGGRATMTPQEWTALADAKIAQMREVERRVSSDLGLTSRQISADASRGALVGSIGVAAILIVSILISLLVASPMITQLRRLRGGALEVAAERLPAVVDRLHRGEPIDMAAEAFPVPATSKDEIGQLADAFATVHEVAVRTAVEQAAMRKSIGDTFLNLARRSQALIHRQLKIIDALERKETDPDELEELFRLDHLATRMRRHAEDLIVLSGSKPARGWRRPVPIKDIVRGAVAEVEDYTRVKVMPITGGAVSGHAVGDVIHMFAELIENATSFSPPHTPVQVSGHPVSTGFVVEIEDRGLGMNQEEIDALNHRLANPPPFDLSTSERLGLFVVGRLAERHAVQVRLRPSPYGGTMAIVLLPESLLRASEDGTGPAGGSREFAAVGAPNTTAQNGSAPASLNGAGDHPTDLASLAGLDPSAPAPDARWNGAGTGTGEPAAADGPRSIVDTGQTSGPSSDQTLLDDLPVFATARSSWFVANRTRGGRPLDEDGAGLPPLPGDHTSPMPLSEVDGADELTGDAPEQPGAGEAEAESGWQAARYGPDAVESADRWRHPNSLFNPPVEGSLFTPPDTSQFPTYGAGRSGTDGYSDGSRSDTSYGAPGGPGGFGGRGATSRAGFGATDQPTSEVSRSPLGPGDVLGRGGGEYGGGSGYGDAGFGDPLNTGDLPVRRRPLGNPLDRPSGYVPPARQAPEETGLPYRSSRPDRDPGYQSPTRGGQRDTGPRDGGPGYQGYLDPLSRDGAGSYGDGYRPGPSPSRGSEAGSGRTSYEQGAGPEQGGSAADDGELFDELGLPKRRRRANLAPQLRRENVDSSRPVTAAGPRSPEEIRSMMSSFQANFGRGIEDGTLSNDGDDVGKVT